MRSGGLPVDEGFRLWAPTYESENPLTELDQMAVQRLLPAPAGGYLLDVGCGTGRRLPLTGPPHGPAFAVGMDLVPAMLLQGRKQSFPRVPVMAGRLEALPLRPGLFDVVWCRLTIGFITDLESAFRSLASQLRPSGRVLVSDLHPEMAAAGAERGFRDPCGDWRVIRAQAHSEDRLLDAAHGAGLELAGRLELTVGPEQEESYLAAGREDLYEEHRRRSLVLALVWRFRRER